jgi:hypothetical protein
MGGSDRISISFDQNRLINIHFSNDLGSEYYSVGCIHFYKTKFLKIDLNYFEDKLDQALNEWNYKIDCEETVSISY